jgi:hypothetical protein
VPGGPPEITAELKTVASRRVLLGIPTTTERAP